MRPCLDVIAARTGLHCAPPSEPARGPPGCFVMDLQPDEGDFVVLYGQLEVWAWRRQAVDCRKDADRVKSALLLAQPDEAGVRVCVVVPHGLPDLAFLRQPRSTGIRPNGAETDAALRTAPGLPRQPSAPAPIPRVMAAPEVTGVRQ